MSAMYAFLADASAEIQKGANKACGTSCNKKELAVLIGSITNALVFLVGAVAVIMIIIGGLRYVISNGDQKQIESAKNTLLYAVIGLVVAMLAYAIVNFVAKQF